MSLNARDGVQLPHKDHAAGDHPTLHPQKDV